ncbi:hypothetical protein NDU88_006994 [Pleurodeles waltl]|uniref:Secreted protein n=1 Tax=Pleurodeles waltl TaxID=8319 RepID=A0AAV7QQK6_PLEWA|nr:hypothetical protein NDU88_006994 [Pleurodeles waltl]
MALRFIPFMCTVVALVPMHSSFSPLPSRHLRPSQRPSVFSDCGVSLCLVLCLVERCDHAPECNRNRAQVLAQLKAVSQRQTVFSQFCGCKCCGAFGVVCTVVGPSRAGGRGPPAVRSTSGSVIQLILRPRPLPLTASLPCQSMCFVPRPIPFSVSVNAVGLLARCRPVPSAITGREGSQAAGSRPIVFIAFNQVVRILISLRGV